MIQKKSFINTIKRALQSGTFNFVGQQASEFPPELFKIDSLNFDDQNWWDCVAITKIDVSNNSISLLPQELLVFPDLQQLRLRSNQIVVLPAAFEKFLNLKLIDMSKNKLLELPDALGRFPAIVELNVSENTISNLPHLHEVRTLQVANFSHNRIKMLPIFGDNLKKLDASVNQIVEIRAQTFIRCRCLEHLDLSKNIIEFIEKESFSNANNMISLEMKENRLTEFNEVPVSQRLDTISLAFNRLTSYNSFSKSPKLTVLILGDNKLKSLSKDIIQLSKLKTLDLSNNDLSDLPCEIGFIASLVRIQLQGNPMKSIRQNVKTAGTNAIKKYLQDKMDPTDKAKLEKNSTNQSQNGEDNQYWNKLIHQFTVSGQLVLRKLQLKQLHEIVFEKNLRTINITDNLIKEISDRICQLQTLKTLIVNNNQLQALPTTLGKIPTLQTIQAKANRLNTFGDETHIANLYKCLHHLDLSANKFTLIPKSILLLPRLRTLLMSYNQLVDVGGLWKQTYLPMLQVLDLSSNHIEEIGDQIFKKYFLNYVNFENNNIAKLPTVLGFMKISGLKVDGNPLKMIKRSIIEKGTTALLDFLRTKHTGDPPELKSAPKVQQPKQTSSQTFLQNSLPSQTKSQQTHSQKLTNYQSFQQISSQMQQLQTQIITLQRELQNNISLNNIQKIDKKKRLQSLMIEKNKLKSLLE